MQFLVFTGVGFGLSMLSLVKKYVFKSYIIGWVLIQTVSNSSVNVNYKMFFS